MTWGNSFLVEWPSSSDSLYVVLSQASEWIVHNTSLLDSLELTIPLYQFDGILFFWLIYIYIYIVIFIFIYAQLYMYSCICNCMHICISMKRHKQDTIICVRHIHTPWFSLCCTISFVHPIFYYNNNTLSTSHESPTLFHGFLYSRFSLEPIHWSS